MNHWTACLDCQRGPKGTVGEQCAAGWRSRTRKTGCYIGEPRSGSMSEKAQKKAQAVGKRHEQGEAL